MSRWTLLVLIGLLSGCAPSLKELKPALADTDSGTIWFASAASLVPTKDGSRLVQGEPIPISGQLTLPSGAGPFPGVVLAHGCAGPGYSDVDWTRDLVNWGYAVFSVDSFRGRGLTEVCTKLRALSPTQRIPDAYGALRILATHPRINARRVALMGFSHGGVVTLRASTAWAKDTYAPSGQPAFRAFLPFYPFCGTVHPERDRISAPLRIHTGAQDDWTPASPCAQLVESLRAAGNDADIKLYAGGHHGFDRGAALSTRYLPGVENPAACVIRIPSLMGPFPDEEISSCMRRGATIGGNAETAGEARRVVRAQLAELLR
jgi:dienelactone hydrolase